MKLYIDGQEAEIESSVNLSVSLAIADTTKLNSSKTGYTKTIELPITPNNMSIMGHAEQVNDIREFNSKQHKCWIEADGCRIIDGVAVLKKIKKDSAATGRYVINIVGAASIWVEYAQKTKISQLEIDFSEKISGNMILNSWSWDKPVRFLKVDKGFAINSSPNKFEPDILFEDFHPFINLKTLMKAIFNSTGYNIDSEFFDTRFFSSLYISGNYRLKDIRYQKEFMDFKASRISKTSAKADKSGKVFGREPNSETEKSYSLGNLVETASPLAVTDNSTVNMFNNGDCFKIIDNKIAFVPLSEISAGFEYRLKYTTPYRIENTQSIKAFTEITIDGQTKKIDILKEFIDRKKNLTANKEFTIVIADYDGSQYLLRYDEVTNPNANLEELIPGDYVTKDAKSFAAKSTTFSISSSFRITNPVVWYRTGTSGTYRRYTGGFAIYDGYIKEQGSIAIDVTFRTLPQIITHSSPKYLDEVVLAGADPGMELVLDTETSIRPLFAGYPVLNSQIEFEDVANHNFTCLDLINAVKHMFNLTFYTDETSKSIIIEPQAEFTANQIIDWSEKIDYGKNIEVEKADIYYDSITLKYADGDHNSETWNKNNSDVLGSYTHSNADNDTQINDKTYTNNLFTPAVTERMDKKSFGSAYVLKIGNQKEEAEINFSPKIVRYLGLTDTLFKEQWGWPAEISSYPFAAFHHGKLETSPGTIIIPDPNGDTENIKEYKNGFTLCFEDRDGHEGLNKFYTDSFNNILSGKRFSAYVHLTPPDVEPFVTLNSLKKDFRSLYKLEIDGETIIARLEEICNYNPSSDGSTKCIFTKKY